MEVTITTNSEDKINVRLWLERGKAVLSNEELELYELALLSGAIIDPEVFKNILDLLRLNVAPSALERMLRAMLIARFPH